MLARAHREQALDHFERALRSDVADIQGGTTAEGVHLGAMAGCVDLLQRCFAGLETRQDALWFNPHWPQRFGGLEFAVQYRGQPLTVRVSGREVRVSAEPGPGRAVRVGCGDRSASCVRVPRLSSTPATSSPACRTGRRDDGDALDRWAGPRTDLHLTDGCPHRPERARSPCCVGRSSNIVRHARASTAEVDLTSTSRHPTGTCLT